MWPQMKPQPPRGGKAPIGNGSRATVDGLGGAPAPTPVMLGLGLDRSRRFRPAYPIVMSVTHNAVPVSVGGPQAAEGTCRNA